MDMYKNSSCNTFALVEMEGIILVLLRSETSDKPELQTYELRSLSKFLLPHHFGQLRARHTLGCFSTASK